MFPRRSTTSGSPACGPPAVTSVPVKTTASVSAANARLAQRSRSGTNRSPGPTSTRRASTATTTAVAEHDDREQEVRHHGDRIEVEPDRDQAERRLRDRPERRDPRAARAPTEAAVGRKCDAIAVPSESRIGKRLTTRFPNSTNEW